LLNNQETIADICIKTCCHNPTNNLKQLKTVLLGWYYYRLKKNHHHHTTTPPHRDSLQFWQI
jgi:hypothetical protein